MEKTCEACGHAFKKRPRDSDAQWSDRAFCSLLCANKMKRTMPPHLYFWKHVDRKNEKECWPWNGIKDAQGYGRVIYMTSIFKAHRVSYEMFHGPIPEGLLVLHSCDNPNCVNPFHLEAGTQQKNMKDAYARGRLSLNSTKNLRPGEKGFYGAGPISNGEKNGG